MFVDRIHDSIRPYLQKAGLTLRHDGFLEAVPYSHDQLQGCDSTPVLRSLSEDRPAEAYLKSLGYNSWKSAAQKEAAWATLNASPGRTLLVVLPTGSGKSLCFQLLPRFTSGLTVVVVPTVALAIDQCTNAIQVFKKIPEVNPRFFSADDDPQLTAKMVKERRTSLIFTSPEACVSGRLRPILDKLAADGCLANLVVDEAHLVETWGAHFRVEFQVLASVRRKWLTASGNKMRTFLFSATMTPECRALLNEMFSDGEPAEQFVCQRLRPEIRYYICNFEDTSTRDQVALETIWHLPRPAILYTTERGEAERFSALMLNEGFQRIGCFHGDTSGADRRDLLHRWKTNDIDLMIATSAFGVGVDKPDIRAIVHACFPENLDRYYQEAGRGGRDGWSSVSILLPTTRARKIAKGITVRLMRPEMIQKRWQAMFNKNEHIAEHDYALPMSSRRTDLVGTRTYSENVRWNKRLLLQLFRADLLELLDIQQRKPSEDDDEREEWAIARIKFPPSTPALADKIADQRKDEVLHFQQGLELFDAFLDKKRCAARQFADLYRIPDTQRACSGCPRCREKGHAPAQGSPLETPTVQPPAVRPTTHMVENFPSPLGHSERPEFTNAIFRAVTQKGLRHFICPEKDYDTVFACFSDAFSESDRTQYRLDVLDDTWAPGLGASYPLVFLHLRDINQRAFAAGRCFRSDHLFCGILNQHDLNGRHVSVNEGAQRWNDAESWLSESQDV
jgi:ATP-dependent DNA helicase RecQ